MHGSGFPVLLDKPSRFADGFDVGPSENESSEDQQHLPPPVITTVRQMAC